MALPLGCGDFGKTPIVFLNTDAGAPYPHIPPDAGGGQPPVVIPGGLDAGLLDGGAVVTPKPPPINPVPDGGVLDGGAVTPPPAPDAGPIVLPPTGNGWTFYGLNEGGPVSVFGVTSDPSGNIWVAGGEDGLFLLKLGASRFQRFTMTDGLHPYGYMADGSEPPGTKYLSVISVAGGPANTVFVGYQGKPAEPGARECEDNWDGPNPDPSIYKSGDADRVALNTDGTLAVVHYDIFTGPGVVKEELRGREKLCNILRLKWDRATHSIWFGGNHGFAWGKDDFAGNPTCNGQILCAGVFEHVHPAINGCSDEQCTDLWLFTDAYYGIAPTPNGDVYFGGAIRSTRFYYGTENLDYFTAQLRTEGADAGSNRFDVWPDLVTEPDTPKPSQRVDDNVSSIALDTDGSIWVGSFIRGVAHLSATGQILGYVNAGLLDQNVDAMLRDPVDQSLWVGQDYGGIVRFQTGQTVQFDYHALGSELASVPVFDLQTDGYGGTRRLLVAFRGKGGKAGAIGVYNGP